MIGENSERELKRRIESEGSYGNRSEFIKKNEEDQKRRLSG
jgi:Arc/MetJ-type ribon-helix-helix transcriptional regulator